MDDSPRCGHQRERYRKCEQHRRNDSALPGALFPHEKANLSAVLYNCDSAGLPHAVVTKIHALHEDDIDSRCEVVLRHRDKQRLHSLYERIVELADTDADAFVASEASRDFMARLRIGIMADEAPVPDPKDGPQTDLVFLHDVISRPLEVGMGS